MGKLILSLFDHSGNWPRPYCEAGYTVILADLKHGIDVMKIDTHWLDKLVARHGKCHGVLMAPPCTDFAGSGAQYWAAKDADGRTRKSVALVRHSLDIASYLQPQWWALENPVGRLNTLIPLLADFGPVYFHPWEFGGWLAAGEKSHPHELIPPRDAYPKKTGLWGACNFPQKCPVPYRCRISSNGDLYSEIHMGTGGKSERTKEIRSITPMGFARAFFYANP